MGRLTGRGWCGGHSGHPGDPIETAPPGAVPAQARASPDPVPVLCRRPGRRLHSPSVQVSTTASTKGGVDACEEESRQEEDGKEGRRSPWARGNSPGQDISAACRDPPRRRRDAEPLTVAFGSMCRSRPKAGAGPVSGCCELDGKDHGFALASGARRGPGSRRSWSGRPCRWPQSASAPRRGRARRRGRFRGSTGSVPTRRPTRC